QLRIAEIQDAVVAHRAQLARRHDREFLHRALLAVDGCCSTVAGSSNRGGYATKAVRRLEHRCNELPSAVAVEVNILIGFLLPGAGAIQRRLNLRRLAEPDK